MKRISWSKVTAGDVVRFRYKGLRSGKSRQRTCLILNERHMHRKINGGRVKLVHALQLRVKELTDALLQLQEQRDR